MTLIDDTKFEPAPEQVPTINSCLSIKDRLGDCMVRWGMRRGNYSMKPGLYALGAPDQNAFVIVSANYRLTLNALRKKLKGQNLWLLILDTRGINVWCAAGKGTFSTAELLRQIKASDLKKRVSHRKLILPQLGAPGVSAHEIKAASGFSVVYGPVYASDLPAFIAGGLKADMNMRRVRFSLRQRLAVIPVELVQGAKYFLLYSGLAAVILFFMNRLDLSNIIKLTLPLFAAFFCGLLLVPLLLPFLPFRPFALKGAFAGIFGSLACGFLFHASFLGWLGYILLIPAVSAFIALNFTGCTTFTSQSGVNKEIRLFAKPIGLAVFSGILSFLADIWI